MHLPWGEVPYFISEPRGMYLCVWPHRTKGPIDLNDESMENIRQISKDVPRSLVYCVVCSLLAATGGGRTDPAGDPSEMSDA